MPVSIAVAE
jgi:hypothetical protein